MGQNFQQFVQEKLRSGINYVYNFCLKILVVWLREISRLVDQRESVCSFSFFVWELMNSTLKTSMEKVKGYTSNEKFICSSFFFDKKIIFYLLVRILGLINTFKK